MIKNFKDKDLEKFAKGLRAKRVPSSLRTVLEDKLTMLNVARSLSDLRVPPANRLKTLKGDMAGRYSIRVNRQFRLVFRWIEDMVCDLELVDYH